MQAVVSRSRARCRLNIKARHRHPQALYGRLDRVFVPDMYEELTTQRVLVMEWVNGSRLRSGTDGAFLAPPTANQLLCEHVPVSRLLHAAQSSPLHTWPAFHASLQQCIGRVTTIH